MPGGQDMSKLDISKVRHKISMEWPRMFFIPSLYYNKFLQKIGHRDKYNKVDENVYQGSLPDTELAEEVSIFFSSTTPVDLFSWVLY